MAKRQYTVATLAFLGALGLSAGAYAVTPGQTTGQAASSTGGHAANQPATNQVGKSSDCSTTGGAVPKSGAWTGEQKKGRPGRRAPAARPRSRRSDGPRTRRAGPPRGGLDRASSTLIIGGAAAA